MTPPETRNLQNDSRNLIQQSRSSTLFMVDENGLGSGNGSGYGLLDGGEMFMLRELPGKVVDRTEVAAKADGLVVRKKKECGMKIEGGNGDLVIGVGVYRLTAELVMVEVKRFRGDAVDERRGWIQNKIETISFHKLLNYFR